MNNPTRPNVEPVPPPLFPPENHKPRPGGAAGSFKPSSGNSVPPFFWEDGPKRFLWAILLIAVITFPGYWLRQTLDTATIAMVYLLGIMGIARWGGFGPAVLASVSGILALDYFINPPYFSFTVDNPKIWLTFFVMLVVSLLISALASRLREQAQTAQEKEMRTSMLYDLSRTLADSRGNDLALDIAARHLGRTVGARVRILLSESKGWLSSLETELKNSSPVEWKAIERVFQGGYKTGRGTNLFPQAQGLYLPLIASQQVLGILEFHFPVDQVLFSTEEMVRLETLASQMAVAVERNILSRQAEDHRIAAENEKNRSALLSAVSHDLRTPLTAIVGASSSLMDPHASFSPEERSQLSRTIYEEADRMNRLIQNLLDMTRLESGALRVKKEWQSAEEVVGAALDLLKRRLSTHSITIKIQPDLPLVSMDALLVEQLLLNLMENALNHTPEGTPIELSVRREGNGIEFKVSDRGPGLAPGEEISIFEKFTRGSRSGQRGVGLGLSICRGITTAHGGTIEAANRPGGGSAFTVLLPIGGTPPTVQEE